MKANAICNTTKWVNLLYSTSRIATISPLDKRKYLEATLIFVLVFLKQES